MTRDTERGTYQKHDVATTASGIELIAQERERQVSEEGWTPEHDDHHDGRELRDAALCYLQGKCWPADEPWNEWPWDASWWKPSDDPVRNLVKAGALIAAEIDRLQRQEASDG